jgi:hypothetical protein
MDLRFGVRARIALIRPQPIDRPELDALGEQGQSGGLGAVVIDRCSPSTRT